MKATWRRLNVIATILILVGIGAWANAIASLLISSEFIVSAELILLFAGMRLLHQDEKHARYALSLLIMAGIAVVLLPVAAYSVSPTIIVTLFGQEWPADSYVAIGFMILTTVAYLATLVWLYILLRKDLSFEN